MLRKIYINNGFRHNDVTYEFGAGMTGIIGPNESGKSLIAEFIRFALFGSKALRGKAEDYKKLHVELWFDVEGVAYHVLRKGTKVQLSREDEPLASGTKPVDEAIRRVLGYDLNVFDVANACTQGNVEALSSMTPTARKAMVDRTIGLDQLDALITHARKEATALKREAAAFGAALVEPEPPTAPEGRTDVAAIQQELDEAQALALEEAQIRGALANAPTAPVEPEPCSIDASLEDLEFIQQEREKTLAMAARTQRQIEQLEVESFSEDLLNDMLEQHDKADRARQKKKLLDQGHLCCPECNHEWPIADLSGFEDVVDLDEPYPPLTRAEIAAEKRNIGNNAKREELTKALEQLTALVKKLPDQSAAIQEVRRHNAAMASYRAAKDAYDTFNSKVSFLEMRIEELAGVTQKVAVLKEELTNAQFFNREQQRFERDLKLYQSRLDQKADLEERAEDYSTALKRLTELKVAVKGHLLPSLNKVASVLLSQMTGGERSLVEVDDDFEILVDGQPIHTLSGSGKAVANLSIRIALGQILTNRVFSVLIADEVDAAMDDERAAYTAEALRRLKSYVGQILLITHKKAETDHMIELRK